MPRLLVDFVLQQNHIRNLAENAEGFLCPNSDQTAASRLSYPQLLHGF